MYPSSKREKAEFTALWLNIQKTAREVIKANGGKDITFKPDKKQG